jgi:hypothetical protein
VQRSHGRDYLVLLPPLLLAVVFFLEKWGFTNVNFRKCFVSVS